jgi:hypothetical protein
MCPCHSTPHDPASNPASQTAELPWGPMVYAVSAESPEAAIEVAWQYQLANEGARELHDYPVALHRDDMLPMHKRRHPHIYRTRIAIKSLRPLKYDNKAEVWE